MRDPTLLPDFKPSHLSINSLLAPTEENAAAEVAAKAAQIVAEAAEGPLYEGPDRRGGLERRVMAEVRIPERRAFGRRGGEILMHPAAQWIYK
jgi:hypothetical protein